MVTNNIYFDQVPLEAWNFYIGGYQPAQKWLKDRKGRKLGYDDIRHYQRIIRVLKETGDVMGCVDVAVEKTKIGKVIKYVNEKNNGSILLGKEWKEEPIAT